MPFRFQTNKKTVHKCFTLPQQVYINILFLTNYVICLCSLGCFTQDHDISYWVSQRISVQISCTLCQCKHKTNASWHTLLHTHTKQAASLMERNNRLKHSRNYCCSRILCGYLATSGAKSDVIFLLGDPDFLQRWQNFAPISLSFRDLMHDKQTDDSQTDRHTVS